MFTPNRYLLILPVIFVYYYVFLELDSFPHRPTGAEDQIDFSLYLQLTPRVRERVVLLLPLPLMLVLKP